MKVRNIHLNLGLGVEGQRSRVYLGFSVVEPFSIIPKKHCTQKHMVLLYIEYVDLHYYSRMDRCGLCFPCSVHVSPRIS